MKRDDIKNVKAVGTGGKRSVMLALVVALVLHDEIPLDDLMREVSEYDSRLEKPFLRLVRNAVSKAEGRTRKSKEAAKYQGGGNYNWSEKRKWTSEAAPESKKGNRDDDNSWSYWQDWGSSSYNGPQSKKRSV